MKFTILILFTFSFFNHSFSQSAERMQYEYIKDYVAVESELQGYIGVLESQVWKRADSLFKNLSLKKTQAYMQDVSYAVRYYAYLKLLYLDEEQAFKALKSSIGDTTKVYFSFGDVAGAQRYDQLLVNEYGDFLYYKYKTGWTFDIPERHYFGNNSIKQSSTDMKVWQKKNDVLQKLIRPYGLTYR